MGICTFSDNFKRAACRGNDSECFCELQETLQDINIVTKRIMHFKKQGISKSFYSYLFGLHWNKVYGSSKVVIWQISFQKYVTKCRNSK